MKRRRRYAFVIAVLIGCTTAFGAGKEPYYIIDPKLSQEQAAPWIFYLGARAQYRKGHHLDSSAAGEIIPTFDEEVTARGAAATMHTLLQSGGSGRDAYWDDVAKIESAGYMKAYIWIYFRRKEWKTSDQPSNLARFEQWRRSALRNHRPQTRGTLANSH